MAIQQTFAFAAAEPPAATATLPAAPPRRSAPPDRSRNPISRPQPDPSRSAAEATAPKATAPKAKASRAADPLAHLRAQIDRISQAARSSDQAAKTFSSGAAAIDRLLPRGGLRPDAISEWVAGAEGDATAALALIAARGVLAEARGPLVVVASGREFFPPAAIALGIDADRVIWVRPPHRSDAIWSIDQALRCDAVAAVWACVGAGLDDRDARRLQLAAEAGSTPGLFVRPPTVAGRPSFADVRLAVDLQTARPHRAASFPTSPDPILRVIVDRCRGGRPGGQAWVKIDPAGRVRPLADEIVAAIESTEHRRHDQATMHLAARLAHPASRRGGEKGRRERRHRA